MAAFRHILSKSTFLRSLQCQKSLYLNKNRKDLRDPITEQQQAVFDAGTNFGLMARELWPDGKDATPSNGQFWDFGPSIDKTKRWIIEGEHTIYEAAFQHEGVLVAVDILAQENGKWNTYEMKGSTSVKDEHIWDAAIQYYIMKKSKLPINRMFIGHIDNAYVRGTHLDIGELVTVEDVTKQVLELQSEIPKHIDQALNTLRGLEPDIDIGPHCSKPYDCDFKGYCACPKRFGI